MSEHDQQVLVFDTLRLNEDALPFLKWVYAVPNGGSRHPAVAGKLKAEGVKRGISDICLPFASADEQFVGGYIEMKFGKNKPSPEQAEFLEFVSRERYMTWVAYSADTALDAIEQYCGVQLRGRR